MISGVKAVLFDLDETLIDATEGFSAAHRAVADELARFIRSRGTEVEETEIQSKLKALDDKMNLERRYNRNTWWPALLDELKLKNELSLQKLEELTLIYWRAFASFSRPYQDAEPTLEYLKKKDYRLGLVTDTDGTKGMKKMRIGQLNLIRFFDVLIISGEDTLHTKPDPEPFLLAAAKLDVKPGECIVVGDKPFTDIKGGNSAGMRTIIVNRRDWKAEDRADFEIESLSEIHEIL